MLDAHHCIDDGFADIFAGLTHIFPMATLGNDKSVQFVLRIKDDIITVFQLIIGRFLIINIGQPLEKQDRYH